MRLHRLIIVCFVLVAAQIVVSSQDSSALPQPRMVEEFGDICCDAERARLENFIILLQADPSTQGYIVYYGGRSYASCWYGGKRHSKRPPRYLEAEARAARIVPYLTDQRGLDRGRITIVDGGFRESWTAELWIVPPGAKPPAPSPTVPEKDIKYRKGRVTRREFERQCEYMGS